MACLGGFQSGPTGSEEGTSWQGALKATQFWGMQSRGRAQSRQGRARDLECGLHSPRQLPARQVDSEAEPAAGGAGTPEGVPEPLSGKTHCPGSPVWSRGLPLHLVTTLHVAPRATCSPCSPHTAPVNTILKDPKPSQSTWGTLGMLTATSGRDHPGMRRSRFLTS